MSLVTPQIIQQGHNYHAQHGTDAGLYVEFHMEAVKNEKRSVEEGRPIFEEQEYITIITPGDTKTKRVRPVKTDYDANTPPDAERWPRQYAAFKAQQTQVSEGTLITEWPVLSRGDVMSLKAMNFHTVEMLANAPDTSIQWMGGLQMREKAKNWLAQAKDGSAVSRLEDALEKSQRQIEALQNQVAAMSSGEAVNEEKRKPGRPAKVDNGENIS